MVSMPLSWSASERLHLMVHEQRAAEKWIYVLLYLVRRVVSPFCIPLSFPYTPLRYPRVICCHHCVSNYNMLLYFVLVVSFSFLFPSSFTFLLYSRVLCYTFYFSKVILSHSIFISSLVFFFVSLSFFPLLVSFSPVSTSFPSVPLRCFSLVLSVFSLLSSFLFPSHFSLYPPSFTLVFYAFSSVSLIHWFSKFSKWRILKVAGS